METGVKKFIITEAWILDENGNKKAKLNILDVNEAFENNGESCFKKENVKGGYGKNVLLKTYNTCYEYVI